MAVLFVPEQRGGMCIFPPGTQLGTLTPFVQAPRFGDPVALPASSDGQADSVESSVKQAKDAMEYVERLVHGGATYYFMNGFHRATLRGIINLKPPLNVAGNLRGLVKNPYDRAIFEDMEGIGKKLSWVGLALSFADESLKAREEIETLAGSSMSGREKLGHGAAIATSIAARVMAGALVQPLVLSMHIVPWITHYGFGQDTTEVDRQIANVETTVRQVTDAKAIETYYLHVRYFITTKL